MKNKHKALIDTLLTLLSTGLVGYFLVFKIKYCLIFSAIALFSFSCWWIYKSFLWNFENGN